MKLKSFAALTAVTPIVNALNILLSNDDGFTSSNIRATYAALKTAGHNVYLFAATQNESGHGGTFNFPDTANLTAPTEFHDFPAGAPSFGHEPDQPDIWYFNATPAACVAFGLDYALPNFYPGVSIDLIVAGPNEGNNPGPAFYTLSGTMGASYYGVYRGIPAIAFSADYNNHSYYRDSTGWYPNRNNESFYSNIYAKKVVQIVNALNQSAGDNPRLLPLGVGLNVNMPYVGAIAEETYNLTCNDPPYIYTRMSGGSGAYSILFNDTTGVFDWHLIGEEKVPGANVPFNGDRTLSGETGMSSNTGCRIAISAFTVDYDAPLEVSEKVHDLLAPGLSG